MSKIIEVENENLPSAVVEREKASEMALIQAQMVMAQRFPRSIAAVQAEVIELCKSYDVAEKARYAFPRGKDVIEGPSIRLIELIAREYGSIDSGWRLIEQTATDQVIQAYAIDLQKNFRRTKTWIVKNRIKKQDGSFKILTDPRDIYENYANEGARRERACLEGVMSKQLIKAAFERCKLTIREGISADGTKKLTLQEKITRVIGAFKGAGVTAEMIEKKLGHAVEVINDDELVELIGYFNSIKDGVAKRHEIFELPGAKKDDDGQKGASLQEKLKSEDGADAPKEEE